jgi:hypothetical protein
VSLSQDPTLSLLKDRFVCGTRDITGEPWSGFSGIHPIDGGAVYTTNGAGPHNIQMFVLATDGTVLTCLPGFWHPEDLAIELKFAEDLNKVWTDASLSKAQKDATYTKMHIEHIASHPHTMVKRSQMQGFDKKFEEKRLDDSDTVLVKSGPKGTPVFKTTDMIMHERLAKQPFKPYSEFDVVAFSDYGRAKYDKNEEGGQKAIDTRPQTVAKRKAAEERRKQMQDRRRNKRSGRG